MSGRERQLLYHFTHESNLRSIANSGLKCSRDVERERLRSVVVGHPAIRRRRSQRTVPVGPGGMVDDYVPFYFAPRSPMLHNIVSGRVPGYTGDQDPIVYLVTDLDALLEQGCRYVVTDRNAAVEAAEFYPTLPDAVRAIDWEVMRAPGPFRGQRTERRMAEVLVHGCVPFAAICEIAIRCEKMDVLTRSNFVAAAHRPPIHIRPEWYF